jgi:hypothetical protein
MNPSSKYALRFLLAVLLYAVLLIVAVLLIRAYPDADWHIPIALLPAIPGVIGARVIASEVGSRDELERQIQLESLAFAFAGTAVVALSIGLLEVAGVPQINGAFYIPIMMALWMLGQVAAKRRYR